MKHLAAFALLALSLDANAESRKVDAFRAIELAGTLAVKARIAPTTSVEVTGDPDLVKQVTTTVKNGTLVIDTPRDFARGRRDVNVEVIVTAPALERVAIAGTGAMDVRGLAAKSFEARLPGTGALRLAGTAEKLHVAIGGSGQVKAKKLVARVVEVDVDGTGHAIVHATKSVDAQIAGTGMVQVHGKPATAKKSVAGTGVIAIK
jgi:hypothetical protein